MMEEDEGIDLGVLCVMLKYSTHYIHASQLFNPVHLIAPICAPSIRTRIACTSINA